MKIAVMQPYYYPYAGYFRLFASADLFVFLDDVQWNRRGRVHRFETKNKKWVTLPIKKTPRDTTMIRDLKWQDDKYCGVEPVDLIIGGIKEICDKLRLPFHVVRSGGLGISARLHGQDRIIAICKKLGATEYVNSPGGRELYDDDSFMKEGIKLTFLPDYKGSYDSVLERLQDETPKEIRQEIMENL